MRIRIVKKLLALMWYKIGQEFEVVRESKAQLGNSHCFLATHIVKVEGIERMVLRQDAENITGSSEEQVASIEEKNG